MGYFISFLIFWTLAVALRAGIPPLLTAYVKKLDSDTENVRATTRAVIEIPAAIEATQKTILTTLEASQKTILAAFESGFAAVETRLNDQFQENRAAIVRAIEDERHARTEGSLRRIERAQRSGSATDLADQMTPPPAGPTSRRRAEP